MRFHQSHTYYLSHMSRTWLWVLDWDDTDTYWNANRWRHILLDVSQVASMLRMIVIGRPHLTSLMPCPASLRPCCLVSQATHDSRESQQSILYCDATGETAPCVCRISTSQISVIFYGIKTLNTVFLVVNAALWGLKEAICLLLGRLLSSSIELARPFRGLQIASCWLVGVGY